MTDITSSTAALPSLQRKFEGRALRSLVLTTLVWGGALLASVPLISVLYMLITRGGARLSLEVFTELPPTGFETGGGFGNAMAGTYDMVSIPPDR
ncbi:phosphate ABC transporter, permease protein PstA, partial [Pseudomonas sp. KHB2.9]